MNALNLDKLNLRSPYAVWCKEEGEYGLKTDYDYIKVSKVVAEKIENYAAIIVQRTNPKLEKIIADFDNFIGFFQNKPQ